MHGELEPRDGFIDLPASPGIGLTLNEENVERRRADR